jgi:hypothetical protein
MDEVLKYNKGGWIKPGVTTVQLMEGEEIIDREGRIRAKVVNGRLERYPLWFSNWLPRYSGPQERR